MYVYVFIFRYTYIINVASAIESVMSIYIYRHGSLANAKLKVETSTENY